MTSLQHMSTDTNTDTCPRQEHDQDRTVSTDTNRIRTLRRIHGQVHGHGHGHMSTDTNTETFHEYDHGHGYGDRYASTNRDADLDTDMFPQTRADFVTNELLVLENVEIVRGITDLALLLPDM